MELRDFDKQISSNELKNVYFLYGDEQFLIESRLKTIKKKLVDPSFEDFNFALYNGKDNDISDILASAVSFPVMAERKLVVLKNTGFLNNAKSREFQEIKEFLKDVPEHLCMIIAEDGFEKKKENNIRFIEELGGIIRFDFMPQAQVEKWLEKLFEKEEKSIYPKEVTAIIKRCGGSLGNIHQEYLKLISYMGERTKVTAEDIEAVVLKSLDVAIYDLIDNIINNEPQKAMEAYKELLEHKTEPIAIISAIASKLSDLLAAKMLSSEGVPPMEMGKYLECLPQEWLIKKTISQSKRFGEKYLRRMVKSALSYDLKAKTGLMDKEIALQLLIADLVK